MTQRLPSCIALMPENPCRGWPLNGVETPVGRGADLSEMYDVPGIVPTASMRRQSGLVYLPETANAAGASLGGGSAIAWAGRYAWPTSSAGNCCWAEAPSGTASAGKNKLTSSRIGRTADEARSRGFAARI